MEARNRRAKLWKAVMLLEEESVERWRQDYHQDLDLETARALHIRSVETCISERYGGNISVTVSCIANRATQSQVEYFSLQMQGNKVVRLGSRL